MFKGIALEDFNKFFQTDSKCRQYLLDLKRQGGYRCKRCGHEKHWTGRTAFHLRCSSCDYDESVTANTIFHKLQIPLLKAFSMVYHIVAFKKGISTIELAKIYAINQKTAWAFKRKVQEAMGTALSTGKNSFIIDKICRLDSVVISHRPKNANGLQRINLEIEKADKRSNPREIVRCKFSLNADEADQCNLVAGRYVDAGKDIRIWNFKGWLTGVHHHCSEKYLKGYLDEFFFRLNFRNRQNLLLHSILNRIIRTKPTYLYERET